MRHGFSIASCCSRTYTYWNNHTFIPAHLSQVCHRSDTCCGSGVHTFTRLDEPDDCNPSPHSALRNQHPDLRPRIQADGTEDGRMGLISELCRAFIFTIQTYRMHSLFNLFLPIAIGCDHAGFDYKEEVKKYLESKGLHTKDFGTSSKDS